MSKYSKETYALMLDNMLSIELSGISTYASETNIKKAIKHVLGTLIKQNVLKGYSSLVLDEELNVHLTITDDENYTFDIVLFYGQ